VAATVVLGHLVEVLAAPVVATTAVRGRPAGDPASLVTAAGVTTALEARAGLAGLADMAAQAPGGQVMPALVPGAPPVAVPALAATAARAEQALGLATAAGAAAGRAVPVNRGVTAVQVAATAVQAAVGVPGEAGRAVGTAVAQADPPTAAVGAVASDLKAAPVDPGVATAAAGLRAVATAAADLRAVGTAADLEAPAADLEAPAADLEALAADLEALAADLEAPAADLREVATAADLEAPAADRAAATAAAAQADRAVATAVAAAAQADRAVATAVAVAAPGAALARDATTRTGVTGPVVAPIATIAHLVRATEAASPRPTVPSMAPRPGQSATSVLPAARTAPFGAESPAPAAGTEAGMMPGQAQLAAGLEAAPGRTTTMTPRRRLAAPAAPRQRRPSAVT